MSKIILATGTDAGFPFEPYLKTVNQYSQVENYCICVDFWPHASTRAAFPNVNFRLLRRDQIDTDVPVNCVQNGDFLKALDLDPDDIIIFTDGDVRMQRPFSSEEIEWLMSLRHGDVSAQLNAGPHDTLLWDIDLLGVRDREYVVKELLENGKYDKGFAYNVGVIACTYGTYKSWHKLYVEEWPRVKDAFTHQAKQQWLMTLLMAKYFTAIPMSYTFHTHGCFPLPQGCGFDIEHRLLYNGEVVLFRHNVRGAGW